MKYDENDTQLWTKVYDDTPGFHAFDVAKDETFTYSLSFSSSRVKIFQQNALDGNIFNGKETTDYYTGDDSKVAVSPNDDAVFISVFNTASNDPALCRWEISTTQLQGVNYPGHNIAKEIIGFSLTSLIFVIEDTSTTATLKIK